MGEVVHGVEACGSLTVRMKILKRRMEENMMEMTKILIESADKQCNVHGVGPESLVEILKFG